MTGLVGWWPLHENSGNTAYDLSGNGNHGSLNGGIVQGVAGKGGLTSYSFDGTDGYVDVPNTSILDFASDEFCISFWAYVPDNDARSRMVGKFDEGADDGYTILPRNGVISVKLNTEHKDVGNTTMVNGEWHHICVNFGEYDGSSRTLTAYLNGYQDGESDFSTDNLNSSNSFFMATEASKSSYWKGAISDVRVYDRALSPREVQELYKWGSGDFASPLNDSNSSSAVSRWAFDGNADDSWGNNDGTVNGAAFVSNDVIRGEALDFNSSNNDYAGLGNDSSLNPDNITVSAWVNSDDVSLSGGIVTRWGTGTDWSYILRTYNGNFRFQARDANDNATVIEENASNNEYYHLVMTYDGSLVRAYVNGVSVGKDDSLNTSLKSTSTPSIIGNRDGNGSYDAPFDGTIDDVRIYDRALSPSEVFELYRWGTRGVDMRKKLVNQR